MSFIGFLIAAGLFFHFAKRLAHTRERMPDAPESGADDAACGPNWHAPWHHVRAETARQRAEHRLRQLDVLTDRERRRFERRARRDARRDGTATSTSATPADGAGPAGENAAIQRARRRAAAEAAFYVHLMSYLGVIAVARPRSTC